MRSIQSFITSHSMLRSAAALLLVAAPLGTLACSGSGDDSRSGTSEISAGNGGGDLGGALAVTATVHVCGHVSAYVAATADGDGHLTIGGKDYTVEANTHVTNEASLAVEANVCVDARVDVDGHLTAPIDVSAGEPGASTGGGSTGGGSTGGEDPAACDAAAPPPPPPCTSGCGSNNGGATGGSTGGATGGSTGGATGGAIVSTTDLEICGNVSAFAASTSQANGYLTIAGNKTSLAKGASLVNDALLTLGANVCVSAKLDANGEITDGSTALNLLGSAKLHVCGTVHAYAASTATADGMLNVGYPHFAIASGAQLSNAAALTVDANVCVDASLTASGKLAGGSCTVK